MSTSTLRFLQQENSRLQQENDVLRDENLALRGYMSALTALHHATREINSEDDLFELLDKILLSAMRVARAEDGSLMLPDEETNELEFVLVHGHIQQELPGYRIAMDQGIAGWVASHQQPLVINNPQQDWRFSNQIDTEFNFATHSVVAVPLVHRGRLMGVVELLNKQGEGEFTGEDVTLLQILSYVAATALAEIQVRLEA